MPEFYTSSSSGTTWTNWVNTYTDNNTTSCYTTSGTCINVWTEWVDGTSDTSPLNQVAPVELIPEELAAQQERIEAAAEKWRIAEAKRKRKRQEARKKAKALLVAELTEQQRDQLNEMAAFLVETEEGRRYRIKNGWSGNVEELDEDGRVIARYCIHPRLSVPHEDNMLAQKLMLETDEAAFQRIANRTAIQ